MVETTYEVYDHDTPNPDNPFPLITVNANRVQDWGLESAYDMLLALDAPNRCGMSIEAILDMDTHNYSLLINSLGRYNQKTKKIMDDLK